MLRIPPTLPLRWGAEPAPGGLRADAGPCAAAPVLPPYWNLNTRGKITTTIHAHTAYTGR
jgi:hypothetical protein